MRRVDARFLLLLLCFAVSGAAGLVLETVWTQEFGLVFGASELAVVAVLAAYMGGLALGALGAARVAHRVRRPLLAYAVLEAAIAVCALGVPYAIHATGRLQAALLQQDTLRSDPGFGPVTLFHFAASLLILLVPTGLMGATLPLLVRHAVRTEIAIGPRVGALYAANTLGAAAGVWVCSFVLLPELGLGRATYAGAAAGGLVAVLALAGGLIARPLAPDPEPSEAGTDHSPRPYWPLVVVALSGAVALGQEIVWTRLLTHVVGGSLYAFGTMLATFLVAIALGAAGAGWLGRTRPRARTGLAFLQLGAAVFTVAAFVGADAAPGWVERLVALGYVPLHAGAAAAAALMLPGALCLGASLPLAVRLLTSDARAASAASGRAVAWNTLGAVTGVAATGLWLLPTLRFAGTMALAAGVCLVLAAVASLAERPHRRLPLTLSIAGLAALALVPLPTPWRMLSTSPLAAYTPPLAAPGPIVDGEGEAGETRRGDAIRFYGVGRSATVLLQEQGAEWRLTGNGLPESAIQPPGARVGRYSIARFLGLLPAAERAGVRRLMVVGFGAGNSIEEVPSSVESVDVVELEPEMLAANRVVSGERRRDPFADPRVRVHLGDARSALALSRQRFDAVVSQPSHPWTAGSSHLFTREFFERVRGRLEPGGVFVQWIGLAFVDEELLRGLIATLRSVFAHVELLQPHPWSASLFVASDRPLDLERQAEPAIAADGPAWRALGLFTAEDLVIARVLDDEGTRAVAAGAAINSDRLNYLQTRSPRVLARPVSWSELEKMVAPLDAVRRLPPTADGLYVARRLAELGASVRGLRAAAALPTAEQRHAAFALLDAATGHWQPTPGNVSAWFSGPAPSEAQAEVRRAVVASLRRRGILAGAPAPVHDWVRSDPATRALVAAWRFTDSGQAERAAALDPELAAIGPRSALYRPATEARVAWRAAVGGPVASREGLALLDPLLATSVTVADLLRRARLASGTGDLATALASLDELARVRGMQPSRRVALLREARALLEGLPAGGPDRLREQVTLALSDR